MFPNRRALDKMGRSSPSIATRSEFGMATSSPATSPAASAHVLSSPKQRPHGSFTSIHEVHSNEPSEQGRHQVAASRSAFAEDP